MGALAVRLIRIWAGWTAVLAVLVVAAGWHWGFGTTGCRLVLVAAGVVDVSIAARCVRTWCQIAEWEWFWWR
jgi:hypothetical protein